MIARLEASTIHLGDAAAEPRSPRHAPRIPERTPRFLIIACGVVCGLALGARGWAKSPNVVLITIDTVRADHVGCYGDRQAHTPTLDALARQGVLFRTVVTAVPLTLPSHCSILTGTYPTVHGVRDNLGYTLGDSPPTLASILKQKGYATAAFVGADVLDAKRGLNRGFDVYSSPFRRRMGKDNPLVFNLQELQRRAEDVIRDALGWMSTRPPGSTKPFFVWIHLYDPHTPYDPPPRFRALVRDPYDGEIAYADYAVGQFFEYLKQHSLYDPTLIVAASDHGESFGEHGEYTHGFFIYDTTLLVPLIIKPPRGSDVVPRRVDTPVRTIDIAPTVLQFLGMPAAPSMQGTGLLSLMLGKTATSANSTAYSETYYPNEFGWSVLRAIRSGRFKYIDAPKPELYDLVNDPREMHNVYETKRPIALELKSQFETLVARITPKEPPQRAAVSPADVELLASLGYVGTSNPAPEEGPGHALADPKDELGTFRVLFSAMQMAAKGQCERAIPLLDRLSKEQPRLFLGHVTLAKCELATGKYRPAESALEAAIRLRPDNLEAQFYKGICEFQEGQFDKALSSLQEVAKSLPGEPYVHFYIGLIYEQRGAAEQALAEYQKCAVLDPDFEVAVYKAGFLLARSGKFADAIVDFKKVIELDPQNASAHHNLALAYAKSGNDAAAQPEFDAACRLDSSWCPPPEQR
ncbi:MAG TPA: sulfatase-like hydrolase/transferase [Terriglobia bacterium]|nr:sulfatase-like hydrolase/transferase [Terriglobia bacterium]